jgi:uncharacterized protein YprB with RNaseH-like and TPR domain
VTIALERIRILRQQSGQGTPTRAPPAPTATTGVPGSAAQPVGDLRRLLRVRAPERGIHGSHARAAVDTDRSLPGEEIAPGLRLIETLLPRDPAPATFRGEFDRRDTDISTSDLLFFDTETTGLAGGTGTRAFMIGTAHGTQAGLWIRQWLISTVSAERALLAAFAQSVPTGAVLVSYNGKSYDAPLLAARFRLARMVNPLLGRDHIDLLYPTRRRYRGHWENCRLSTIERRVLGIVREDDLPGSEAPAAWLGYLRGGSARNLRRVADHNRLDLASLSELLIHHASIDAADSESL